ncbi:uncharacterized protein [Physeter macrocephalus]|nr:uncharacterized protein LOC114486557 isoform X2 [Physeter catodon]
MARSSSRLTSDWLNNYKKEGYKRQRTNIHLIVSDNRYSPISMARRKAYMKWTIMQPVRTTVVCLRVIFLIVNPFIDIPGCTAVFVTRVGPRKLFPLSVLISFRTEVHAFKHDDPTEVLPPFEALNGCSAFPGRTSRWRRSKTWRSSSSPQIHKKYIYMWNNSYRTPTERWQKTSDLPQGKKLPTYLDRAKDKRINRDKRIRMGPRNTDH